MNKRLAACFVTGVLLSAAAPSYAQRQMETLDRGTVAVKVTAGIYVGWRLPATEWEGVSYNIYRDGVKLNEAPITGATNYTDPKGTMANKYAVSAIVDGVEQPASKEVEVWQSQFKEIKLKERHSSYFPTEACVGDLDGDGEMEIIVKRLNDDYSVSNTRYSFIEAYKLDGTFMWEIDLGPNIVMDSNISLGVFDLDGDGKAEVFMRSSEGTIDGTGVMIGDVGNKDGDMIPDGTINYRQYIGGSGSQSFQCAGPEFLSVYEGATGKELDRVEYIRRGNVSDWGDSYGHRANKFMYAAPYLDGKNPSIMTSRGIYTRIVIKTYDFVDKKIVERWTFDSNNYSGYAGQGNHNFVIADVDGDGCDEIVYGQMTVNNDGTGLYTTGMGHGDAMHVGNLDPYRKGLEVFGCHEDVGGTSLRAAEDGSILIRHNKEGDTGRCMAGNITNKYLGSQVWGGGKMFNASSRKEADETTGGPENFVIYWDGDLLQEMLDHEGFNTTDGYGVGAIYKFPSSTPYFKAIGTASSNWTKGVPMLQADILGDWREEVIWRTPDMKSIRIYTTTDPTEHRIYTLLHDMQYRQAVCWQNCEYNQPPHASFFLGEAEGILLPPPAVMRNGKMVYTGNGSWTKSSTEWVKDGVSCQYADNSNILFESAKSVVLTENLAPATLTVNSTEDVKFSGTAAFTGNMKMIKQGLGTLSLSGNHDYAGTTEHWDGNMIIDGKLSKSPVWMYLHTNLTANGELGAGVYMQYNCNLNTAAKSNEKNTLKIKDYLHLRPGAKLNVNYNESANAGDDITVEGDFIVEEGAEIIVNFVSEPASGEYKIMTVTGNIEGDLSTVKISCPQRILCTLDLIRRDNDIILSVADIRSAQTVIWSGNASSIWDFASTENFLLGDKSSIFVTGDDVVFDNSSAVRYVTIPENISPASVTFDINTDFTINGDGGIVGEALFSKSGTGTLIINNVNPYEAKTVIDGGEVRILSNMTTEIRDGALGTYKNNVGWLTVKNGAVISSGSKSLVSEQPMTVGDGGAEFRCESEISLFGRIKGDELIKTGAATMYIGAENTSLSVINVKEGSLKLTNEAGCTNPAGKIILHNGTSLVNLEDSYSYTKAYYNVEVAENANVTWWLDSRCEYSSKLTGSGTIRLNFPYVRGDMNGDFSGFSGVVNLTGSEARMNHSSGMPNAEINVASGVSLYSAKSGGSSVQSITYKIGALSGSGNLTGSNTWVIGDKNVNKTFAGVISAGSVKKTGSGVQTFSGANTYTGGTTIEQGSLNVTNTSGSGTGTGSISITGSSAEKYGSLGGSGIVTGAVTITGYGAIDISDNNYSTLQTGKITMSSDNASFKVKVNPVAGTTGCVKTTSIAVKGKLIITNDSFRKLREGNVFKVIDAGAITGEFSSVEADLPDGLALDLSALYTEGVVKVVAATGIAGIRESDIRIYPNPVVSDLNISLPETVNMVNVSVYNMQGQIIVSEIHENINGELRIDVSALPKGKYVIRMNCDSKNIETTFMK